MARSTEQSRLFIGGQRGFALVAVMFLALLITLVGMAYFAVAGYEVRQAQYQRDYAQAFWAAETGLDRTVVHLSGLTQPPKTTQQPFVDQAIGDGLYDVEVIPDSASLTQAEKRFTLRATGRAGRAVRILEEVVRMEGFARYGYFTNEELGAGGQTIWFFTGDDLGGKIHSNDVFHIAGSPRFRGPVTSAADHMEAYPGTYVYGPAGWPSGSNDPTFDQGFTLGIPPIDLPADTGDLLDAALNGGLSLTGNYEIQFGRTAPGAFSYRPTSGGAWVDQSLSSLSSGVIHVAGTAQIHGVVDGQVTLGASQNIELIADLRYAAADLTTGQPNPGCNDIMGLVAGLNIVVRDLPATRGDMIVDATVMALDTSFGAEDYGAGTPRGTLHIWGGLIQERRGAVGTFRDGVLQTGYIKDYHYDTRMIIQPPPEFPLTGIYTRVSWRERGPAA